MVRYVTARAMNRREMYEALGIPGDVNDWLTRRLTGKEVGEARSNCAAVKPQSGTPSTWWDEQAAAFAARLESLGDGDEVWEFRSPPSGWEHLEGRAGLCVVRDQRVVSVYITMLS